MIIEYNEMLKGCMAGESLGILVLNLNLGDSLQLSVGCFD